MIKFKLEDKEYKLPEFISIENYSKIYKVKDLFSDEYFAAKLVSIVSDAPVNKLMEYDFQEVDFMALHLMNLIPKDKPKFHDRFELDGVKYGFFPSWKDLSFAEFIDMDTISTKKIDELLSMMHILAAVMYRPIVEEKTEHDYTIEKYNVETMKERAELFKKKLDVKYVLGAQFFFIKFANRFLGYTQLSSIPKLTIWMKIKLIWKMRRLITSLIFKRRSVGSLSSTDLLEMILQSMNTSIKKT